MACQRAAPSGPEPIGSEPERLRGRERRPAQKWVRWKEPGGPSRTAFLGGPSPVAGCDWPPVGSACVSPSRRTVPAPTSCDAPRARPSWSRSDPLIAKLVPTVKNKMRTCSGSSCPSRHGRARPAHPRLLSRRGKAWIPGTRPGMTARMPVPGGASFRPKRSGRRGNPLSRAAMDPLPGSSSRRG